MARDYDPAIGRYVESDPLGALPGAGTYTYVGDSPVMKWDFLGLDSRIDGKEACKMVKAGYDPKDDPCSCQKNVVNDLCTCWTKYNWWFQVTQLGIWEPRH